MAHVPRRVESSSNRGRASLQLTLDRGRLCDTEMHAPDSYSRGVSGLRGLTHRRVEAIHCGVSVWTNGPDERAHVWTNGPDERAIVWTNGPDERAIVWTIGPDERAIVWTIGPNEVE